MFVNELVCTKVWDLTGWNIWYALGDSSKDLIMHAFLGSDFIWDLVWRVEDAQ